MELTFEEYIEDVKSQLTCNATEEYKSKYITYIHTNKEVSDNLKLSRSNWVYILLISNIVAFSFSDAYNLFIIDLGISH